MDKEVQNLWKSLQAYIGLIGIVGIIFTAISMIAIKYEQYEQVIINQKLIITRLDDIEYKLDNLQGKKQMVNYDLEK